MFFCFCFRNLDVMTPMFKLQLLLLRISSTLYWDVSWRYRHMLVLVVRDICLISTQVIIDPFVSTSYCSPGAPSLSCFHPSEGQKVNYLKHNFCHGESRSVTDCLSFRDKRMSIKTSNCRWFMLHNSELTQSLGLGAILTKTYFCAVRLCIFRKF